MTDFVWRDGSRLTPYMAYQIECLNRDLRANFGVGVLVSSGIRIPQEQIDIFLQRYVTAGNIRGRKVYDTRVWNGTRYYRISSAGTVAVPGTSNHEIQGSKAAVDLRDTGGDTGGDAGITVASSKRGRWIRQNAWRYGLVASGDGFGEGWHFDILNIWNAVPGGTPTEKGITVIHYHREDGTARSKGYRTLKPGDAFWLHTTPGIATSQATNLGGGIGPTIFTLHVYAHGGTPGDAIDVQLYWDQTKTEGPHSGHYTERMVFDKEGIINRSVTSQRALGSGDAVYGQLRAPSTNKGTFVVSLFDSDAYLIV